ncbi:MAG TPA: class I SAM-dependent methyltransferase [Anaeromyxobacteraceae bacterium]|jgi:2-polyprenyl-3-methyl-5-hydroxy-6-metoxy-1,4-benzoquinol methylase|nr:class I SAM-dependent methyltransferase [Anaeromyxobacteraceae bacterium]
MEVDRGRLEEFMGKAVGDLGAAMSAALVRIGDQLGLYKALAASAATPAELAQRTGTAERYVREWLANQAAGGYVSYDAASGQYSMTPEQAMALAQEDSPVFLPGAFQVLEAMWRAEPTIAEAFRSGGGLAWTEQDQSLFDGTERFFRPGYAAHLVAEWLPSLEGVEEKLRRGARVADVGCGHGASTVLMARAYPSSRFRGFDFHDRSVEVARRRAAEAGVQDRLTFEIAPATAFPGEGYDLVTHFDCLHDMDDPVAAARRARAALAEDGTWMIVEPFAGESVEKNLNPVGRVFYAASTMICVPNSLARHGAALGAQAGEERIRQVAREAGFTRFRRATETPFNLVYEARA